MIEINGKPLDLSTLPALSQVEQAIVQSLAATDVVYSYQNPKELSFELALRTNILQASVALLQSGARFESFQKSYCNPRFWYRMPNGAFQLRQGVRPSSAIDDIFYNGQLYGFECATAIIMIFYKAVRESIDQPSFDAYFNNFISIHGNMTKISSWKHAKELTLSLVIVSISTILILLLKMPFGEEKMPSSLMTICITDTERRLLPANRLFST